MNKDIFKGFINGVVAMYQLGSSLDHNLLMQWDCEQIGNGMLKITCDYCYDRHDKLITAGDYDNEPEYKEVINRDKIVIQVSAKNTVEIAKQINNEILDYLSNIHPSYTIN